MEFKIRNVGKVHNADIEVDGITVIAGYNNTGKTTLLKSVDVLLKVYNNLAANIREERTRSIKALLVKQDTVFDQHGYEDLSMHLLYDMAERVENAVEKNGGRLIPWSQFMELYVSTVREHTLGLELLREEELYSEKIPREIYERLREVDFRDDSVYKKYLAEIGLRREFNQQAVNLINGKESEIEAVKDDSRCYLRFLNNKVIEDFGENLGDSSVIYVETKNILDYINSRRTDTFSLELRRKILRERSFEKEEISFEQYQETENNLDLLKEIFDEVIHGKLISDSGIIKYKDDSIEEMINVNNVASGMKIFLLLQRLVENGTLKEKSWILIDEPETNLHPEWHLKFAEVLILLRKKLNVNILLSSHSPYFMRALEVKMADYDMKNEGKFYLMEEKNGMYASKDVTMHTEEIYEQLYRPLELL